MMGVEPIQRALPAGADIVIAGRAQRSGDLRLAADHAGHPGGHRLARRQGRGMRHARLRDDEARHCMFARLRRDRRDRSRPSAKACAARRRASPRTASTRTAIPTCMSNAPARSTSRSRPSSRCDDVSVRIDGARLHRRGALQRQARRRRTASATSRSSSAACAIRSSSASSTTGRHDVKRAHRRARRAWSSASA